MMYSKYIKAVITAFALLLFLSCNEEFEANSSYFLPINKATKTIIYNGEKAGDFKAENQNIDWELVENLIIEGHINEQDLYIIRNAAQANRGSIKSLDFKNADILEGIFPTNLFYDNRQLKRFVYPRKIMHTGNVILNDCTNLKEVIIPEDVEILGDVLFDEVSSPINNNSPMPQEKYIIPPMVKELGNGCYLNYPYATIHIPNSVEKFGVGCFNNSKLESFVFPPKATIVRNSLFYENKNLKTVKMHTKITVIENVAFYRSGIEELIMPESIISVGKGFIGKTPNLKKIQWSSNITELGDEALAKIEMEEFIVPPNVKSLGRHCFKDAKTKRYYLHKDITTLGEGLFNYLITDVENPKSYIEELHVKWQTPPTVGKAFQVTVDFKMTTYYNATPDFSKVTLYVPRGTKTAYQNAEGWKKFGNIIEE